MKKILPVCVLLLLAGCHDQLNGGPQSSMNKARTACRDGVEYLQFNNSYGDTFAPHLRADGLPYTCTGG